MRVIIERTDHDDKKLVGKVLSALRTHPKHRDLRHLIKITMRKVK
jgi:hypothetical protein